jgi:hypothetical protein
LEQAEKSISVDDSEDDDVVNDDVKLEQAEESISVDDSEDDDDMNGDPA